MTKPIADRNVIKQLPIADRNVIKQLLNRCDKTQTLWVIDNDTPWPD